MMITRGKASVIFGFYMTYTIMLMLCRPHIVVSKCAVRWKDKPTPNTPGTGCDSWIDASRGTFYPFWCAFRQVMGQKVKWQILLIHPSHKPTFLPDSPRSVCVSLRLHTCDLRHVTTKESVHTHETFESAANMYGAGKGIHIDKQWIKSWLGGVSSHNNYRDIV